MYEWIIFVAYTMGIFPAWAMVYSYYQPETWLEKQDARTEASALSLVWPLLVVVIVLYLVWRRSG